MKLMPKMLLLSALAGCAPKVMSIEEGRAAEPLPTSEEVVALVRSNWASDYGKRYAKLAFRPAERAALIDIDSVSCDYYVVTPECSFYAIAHFDNEEPQRRQMSEQFGWTADGQLTAVLVMYHSRRP
ncbi:MAG: hypothetical protein ACK4ZW_04535 [Blastomonas sp.]